MPSFISPIKESFVTEGWGFPRGNPEEGRIHQGMDFKTPIGTDVLAIANGTVALSQDTGTRTGKWIVIKHDDTFSSRYMHLDERLVSKGTHVTQGQVIAKSGETASVGKPHLHFDLQIANDMLNKYLGFVKGIIGKYQAPLGTTVPSEPFIPVLKFSDKQKKNMAKLGLTNPSSTIPMAGLVAIAITMIAWLWFNRA